MRFVQRKRRQPPAVIIVSLIDILIVLLIFMMVTTTFKQHPAIRLALPEAKQKGHEGASENLLVVTVPRGEATNVFYLGQTAVTLDALTAELISRAGRNTNLALTIRGDDGASWGRIVNVMEAASAAKIKNVRALGMLPGQP